MKTVSLENPAQSVTVKAGETMEITLQENPTTGFRWTVEPVSGPLTVVSSEFEPPSSGQAGAGGRRKVVVRADAPGEGAVALTHGRSWEGPASARQRTLTVTVE